MPDMSSFTLGDRISIALRLVPQDQWEELLGKSTNHIRRYEQGLDVPLTAVAALAAETEIPLDWIVTGRAMDRKAPLVRVTPSNPRGDSEDVALQKLAFRPAAGRGTLVFDESADYVRFPRAILDHIGVKPQFAKLMEADGLSMWPTISDRDTMVADVSSTEVIEGKVYVFTIGDQVHVKRLRRGQRGQLLMVSDNRELFPEPEPVPADQQFTVHAQIKWTGRSL